MIAQITAPHFCACLVLANDRVDRAAPIIAWMTGKPLAFVRSYCARKRWLLTIHHDDDSWEFDP
jgi:hypothetical protein